jgi:hypothetical protein
MIHSLLRGSAVAMALATTIGLASTLTACASSSTAGTNAGSGAGSATTGAGATATSSPSPGSSPTGLGSVNPGGPVHTPGSSAQAQSTTLPRGAKYVAIERLSKSPDGRTLYLVAEAQGGACGNFTVVVQETAGQVRVGLAKIPVKTGMMCPMYITARTFPAKLSSPLGSRPVIDLATGTTAG